jgi:(S)-mandelate dehydrogenase
MGYIREPLFLQHRGAISVAPALKKGAALTMARSISVADFRKRAQKRLPKMVFDFLEGGAEDEDGLRHNIEAYRRIKFRPRSLVDISRRSTATDMFGSIISAPLIVAPTGLNGLLWPQGDLALARAAERAGIPFVLSTAANASLEEIADKAGGELWFQLYVVHPALADRLVQRADKTGYRTLVLTVDVQVNGKRERDMRNGFSLPLRYTPRLIFDCFRHPYWSLDLLRQGMPQMKNLADKGIEDVDAQAALLRREMDASFDWKALERLRDAWPHRLLVKGILSTEDASRCFASGVDGVILSNHGGRQLDHSISAIEALPEIAGRASGAIFVDGGIRRGSDIVKAVALGASAGLVGRAVLYGLAAGGEAGAFDVLQCLKQEIDCTLGLLGCPDIKSLGPHLIAAAFGLPQP